MTTIRRIVPLACILFYGTAVIMSTVSGTRQSRTVAGQNYEIPNNYEAYVPTTPLPENVNCYIEVPTVQTVGGRCVRFGRSRRWSCQSGIHMQISDDCERLSRRNDQRRTRTRPPRT